MSTGNEKNRGYYKIKGASHAFNFDSNFKDKIVLDIGSSTGGFTQYSLEQGAKKVIAIEKGTNQMKSPLRDNPKVELYEKCDIFDFICTPDIIVADVSFVSLTKILKYAKNNLSTKDTDFLVMLKPQFEAKPHQLNNGIIKNEKIRREIIKDFEFWLKSNNFIIIKKHDNALQGKHGNIERFYWLKLANY
ncbi:hypothetical protein IKF84_01755 [Candidatus Saccharibacteria bacterium]|nr:hypothetical protein [Candidatus Saccharibacteria bacterium]